MLERWALLEKHLLTDSDQLNEGDREVFIRLLDQVLHRQPDDTQQRDNGDAEIDLDRGGQF